MITAASLKSYTVKDLGQMAKKAGVPGWHAMRKDQLVRALVRSAKLKAKAKVPKKSASASKSKRASAKSAPARKAALTKSRPRSKPKAAKQPPAKPSSPRVARRIAKVNAKREEKKDLTTAFDYAHNGRRRSGETVEKDRIVLLVRDSYWLQACWELTRQSVQRAKAAMAEHWHTAKPVLRLLEVESGSTTSTAERLLREIEIHGGVKNWYIDVQDPPQSYRIDIGYVASSGRYYSLARSNVVTTPRPGSSDALDENWTDVAENYERIYALSGGYADDQTSGDLQDLFEERLRRPMGSPVVTRFGAGAERMLNRQRELPFEVDAELIIYGSTRPDAHVCLAGEPIRLRPDGTFTVRLSMPDRRQVLPVVASSADGVEQRTIVLAVERNTKVMEPIIHESNQ